MKKTGICPKCKSSEIYFDSREATTLDPRGSIFIARRSFGGHFSAQVETYVCINCGYFEEYITEQSLKDSKMIEKIKTKWKKLS